MLKKRGFSRIVQPQDQHVVLLAFRVLGIERRCQMKHRELGTSRPPVTGLREITAHLAVPAHDRRYKRISVRCDD